MNSIRVTLFTGLPEKRRGRPIEPTHDPWLALCDYCEAPNGCIRTSGDFQAMPQNRKDCDAYEQCVIYRAAREGLTPEEALRKAKGE